MDWFGFFIIILIYGSYPSKTKKLEAKVKKLERIIKGDSKMSKIINSLVGKKCKIDIEGMFFTDCIDNICTVIDADEEWIKVSYSTKKDILKTKIIRIESIEKIEEITE